ncbi:MAG: multidrug effflux MFS transporter [Alphaproteobacteria bacterium]
MLKKSDTLPLWLLILIVGFPVLSETVYTPALPDIAHSLKVPDSWVEYTLTIYLMGFAVGTFLWGILSDTHGRKPYLLLGFLVYVLGTIGCYYSESIEMLLTARFIQAFGGSTGSVLGQAITRDSFQGSSLNKVYALVGSAIGIFPALGPVIGGVIDQSYGWHAIFLFLIGWGVLLWFSILKFLPETHQKRTVAQKVPILHTMNRLLRDKRVLGFCFLVGAGNGIFFSYCAEGPFFLIEVLGLTPSAYGATFFGLSGALVLGGFACRKLLDHYGPLKIIQLGLHIMLATQALFCGVILASHSVVIAPSLLIATTIITITISGFGSIMVNSSSLSVALENYRDVTGTASSFLGLSYYIVISLFTLGMGLLHNGTLMPMPLYFLAITLAAWVVFKKVLWIPNRAQEK